MYSFTAKVLQDNLAVCFLKILNSVVIFQNV